MSEEVKINCIKDSLKSDVVCHLCLSLSNKDVCIINNNKPEDTNSLKDKTYMLFNIEVAENDQPQFICINCNDKLFDFYQFYNLVLKNKGICSQKLKNSTSMNFLLISKWKTKKNMRQNQIHHLPRCLKQLKTRRLYKMSSTRNLTRYLQN